ncbi:CoA-transferase subunit beta [Catelliglobosispora koreensis]|uniref:CoA-transferase subunit beta n=1 Tax=Catelliglobosispora koreensis TaxID=129052 RepID=UPI000362C4CC|nr:CoA-transferase [Catelliglobosispora koreensis]
MKLSDVCVVACAEAFRGDGEILASPMGLIPSLGAKLARATFSPGLLISDGEAYLINEGEVEGWMPYRQVFTVVASGRRHVMMGASQIDRFGNQNISCIGPWERPKSQLLGVRGAPGNTINHPTSYFVPKHSPKAFVEKVDMVSGLGYDRGAHEIRVVITNLAVLDFATETRHMRLRSVHPGVNVSDVVAATGFALSIPDSVPQTRLPSPEELEIIQKLDPANDRDGQLPAS